MASVSSELCQESTHGEPHFPAELEREIFEIAALQDRVSISQLMLVAKRVKTWLEPILYNVILQTQWKPALSNYPPLYENVGRTMKSPRFKEMTSWATHVGLQNLKVSQAIQILESCVNIRSLALWIIIGPHEPLRKIIPNLPVQRLHVNINRFFSVEDPVADSNFHAGPEAERFRFDHTPLMNLTHLHILLLPIVPWAQWKSITLLPRLSHLAVDRWHPEFTKRVLEECKSLKLLVMVNASSGEGMLSHDSLALYLIVRGDPRLVKLTEPQWIDSWERGALTGNDIWSRAEARAARKRKKSTQ